jgi:FkbM family methyltransferase
VFLWTEKNASDGVICVWSPSAGETPTLLLSLQVSSTCVDLRRIVIIKSEEPAMTYSLSSLKYLLFITLLAFFWFFQIQCGALGICDSHLSPKQIHDTHFLKPALSNISTNLLNSKLLQQFNSSSGEIFRSAQKAPDVDEFMARLFQYAPPGITYQQWIAPSPNALTHREFLNHPFSACCLHPFPPLDRTIRQVTIWPSGFFIESGGHDGEFQSNTIALEKYLGWRGILIEPAMKNIPKIQASRNRSVAIHAALVSQEQDGARVNDPGGNPEGKVSVGSGNVLGRSLSSLLDELNVTIVDFWSLDVEGYEISVLKGLDFQRHRPKLIVIEVWNSNKDDVFSIMDQNGYFVIPGYDSEGGLSGFPKGHAHRDYLWRDSRWTMALPAIRKPIRLPGPPNLHGEHNYAIPEHLDVHERIGTL